MTFFRLSRRWFLRILGSTALVSHVESKIPYFSEPLAAASGNLSQVETDDETARDLKKAQTAKPDENVQVFRWSGGQYKHDVENFISEFLNYYGSKRPYPISKIFQIFPFQVTEAGRASDLIKRGDITFAGGAASNTGEGLDVEFKDQNVGRLSIVFGQKMVARITDASLKAFNLQFDAPNRVPVVFYELDPAHEMGPNQRLESISFHSDLVSYTLCELGHETQKVRIEIDLTQGESKPQPTPARKKLSGVPSDEQKARIVPASLALGACPRFSILQRRAGLF
jgi:hypothetical protein